MSRCSIVGSRVSGRFNAKRVRAIVDDNTLISYQMTGNEICDRMTYNMSNGIVDYDQQNEVREQISNDLIFFKLNNLFVECNNSYP